MRDERSIKALEVAERFGLGSASEQELRGAAADAAAAYAAAGAAGASKARRENRRLTARICVEILGQDIIEAVNKLITDSNTGEVATS